MRGHLGVEESSPAGQKLVPPSIPQNVAAMDAGIASRTQMPGLDAGVAEACPYDEWLLFGDRVRNVDDRDVAAAFRRAIALFEPAPECLR